MKSYALICELLHQFISFRLVSDSSFLNHRNYILRLPQVLDLVLLSFDCIIASYMYRSAISFAFHNNIGLTLTFQLWLVSFLVSRVFGQERLKVEFDWHRG